MTGPEIGDAIHRLGRDWAAGRLPLAAAVAKLRELDPTLTQLGATGQIKAWRTAPSRYRARTEPDPAQLDQRRVSNAALRREPITIRIR